MGGAALHLGNIAEMKTGEGKTLVGDAAGLPQRPHRRGRPHRHGQRLPRRARRRVDGPRPPVPRAERRRDPRHHAPRRAARAVRLRHHLRHQQRVRVRLSARQHGVERRGARAARPPLRDRRRGRLDPHRRGPHPADHQRPGRPGRPSGTPSSPASCRGSSATRDYEVDEKKRTVGVLESGIDQGRGPARHREPLRERQHPPGRLPQQRDQGQGAVQGATRTTS